tara:strand:+ start:543 stop:3548 length:3006 start_codon:yes stop_codon:yes gene_type:complete
MLGLGTTLSKASASVLTYVKDNLKLYLDFKSNKSNTLKFPCEGSTYFDGTDDYISIADDDTLDLTGDITICAWFKLDDTSNDNYAHIINKGDKYFIKQNGTASTLLVGFNDGSYRTATTGSFTQGKWHHVAMTYDEATITPYLDGVAGTTTSIASTLSAGTSVLTIGAGDASSNFWEGNIANVGIWSRVLSIEEINSVMRKNYSQLKSVEKTSLVAWWALDSGATSNNVSHFYSTTDSTAGVNHQNSNAEETLGVELVTAMNIWPNPADVTTTVDTDTNTVTMEADDSSGAVVAYMDGTANGFLTSRLSADKIYKITFNATWTNRANNPKLIFYHEGGQNRQYLISTQGDYVFYERVDSVNGNMQFNIGFNSADQDLTLSNLSVKEVTSLDGWTTTATTTTSVYGGNAPVLPRAVDVAKEGEAEAIGDGSASFTASNTDYIVSASNINLDGGKSRTFSAWIRRDSAISSGSAFDILSYGAGSNGNLFEYGILNDSGTYKAWANLYGEDFSVAQDFDIGEWYHFAVVYTAINSTTGTLKLYVNSILLGTSGTLGSSNAINTTNDQLDIGRRNSDAIYFDGDIAQLGAWAGALTQAQIQSVMESTSYATIPASVKSTVGADIAPTSWTGTNATTSESTDYAHSGTTSRKYITSGSGGVDGIYTSTFTTVQNALYKLDMWVYSPSQGDITVRVVQGDGSGYNLNEEITIATGEWVNIVRYFVESGGSVGSAEFFVGNNLGSAVTQYIDDISIKAVTNDLVGYWGLDSSTEALIFDGSGDYITFGTGLGTFFGDNYAGDITISTWVRNNNASQDAGIFRIGTTSNTGNISLTYSSNLYYINLDEADSGGPDWYASSGAGYNDTTSWHHIVFVYNSTSPKMYIDGVLLSAGWNLTGLPSNFDMNGNTTEIGKNGTGTWNGNISQVAVYNKELSSTQVTTQYNLGIEGDYSSDSGLVGYWKLDTASTSSNAITDLSTNSNHGTVQGNPTLGGVVHDSTSNNNDGTLV